MSYQRTVFEAEARRSDYADFTPAEWANMLDMLNALSMAEMLPSISGLSPAKRDEIAAKAQLILLTQRGWKSAYDRIQWVVTMVQTRRVAPAPAGVFPPGAGAAEMAAATNFVAGLVEGRDGAVSADTVKLMFPGAPLGNIIRNLPYIIRYLHNYNFNDKIMLNMALSTIRAEASAFAPVPEGQSRFNTRATPFDLYENRSDLGNTEAGDGPRFKGRGFVQLTGRSNYQSLGNRLGLDLVGNPDLANEPANAALILVQFLSNAQTRIRTALQNDDLVTARRAVNGGTNGLDQFSDAYTTGDKYLPYTF